MKALLDKTCRFVREEEGASAIEYALIVALTAMTFFAGVVDFGTTLNTWFSNVASTVLGWAS